MLQPYAEMEISSFEYRIKSGFSSVPVIWTKCWNKIKSKCHVEHMLEVHDNYLDRNRMASPTVLYKVDCHELQ